MEYQTKIKVKLKLFKMKKKYQLIKYLIIQIYVKLFNSINHKKVPMEINFNKIKCAFKIILTIIFLMLILNKRIKNNLIFHLNQIFNSFRLEK